MTVALQVVSFLVLAAMIGCVVLVWRYRTDAQTDIERDRRVERALQRGRRVADEDRPGAGVVLTRAVVMSAFFTTMFLSQATLHLADHGTGLDAFSGITLGLMAVCWVGVTALSTRALLSGRRQGLHPEPLRRRPRARR